MRIVAWLVALLLASTCFAQTAPAPRPDDNVARPVDTVHAQAMPANPSLPTVWIIGDSTAKNKEDLGWGDHFAHWSSCLTMSFRLISVEAERTQRCSPLNVELNDRLRLE
jgi:hypothetical protein